MILWLASYPKSGNTWTRILISQLISKNNNELNFYEEAKKLIIIQNLNILINW